MRVAETGRAGAKQLRKKNKLPGADFSTAENTDHLPRRY